MASRYEPGIQCTYEELARHYRSAVVPARPRPARDKGGVAVQVAERWTVARLRHQTFFSLEALNERIAELLAELNDRRMRRNGGKLAPALRAARPASVAAASERSRRPR